MSSCKIIPIPVSLWKDQNIQGDTPDARLGRQILEAFHEQHVGITPELAQDLARLILTGEPKTAAWKAVVDRLHATWVSMVYSKNSDREYSKQFTHTASPRFWMYRIGLPLIAAACARLGMSAIHCEDDRVPPPKDIDKYPRQLAEALQKAAQDTIVPEAFWRDRILTLVNLTDSARRPEESFSRMPVTTVVEAAMALRDPIEGLADDTEDMRIKLTRQRVTFNPKRHEAGVRGVTFSRREEDIPRMLPSEWMYDEVIQLDRLVNTGFLVFKRPPVPIQIRDALIIGICPPQVARTPLAPFARALWFDLASRVAVLLARSGLNRSELRWIEAQPGNRLRSTAGVVGQIPPRYHIETRNPNQDISLRTIFARALHWYPALIARHDIADVRVDAALSADPGPDELGAWFSAAITQQMDALYWETHDDDKRDRLPRSGRRRSSTVEKSGFSSRRLAMERYRVVHVMHMLPASFSGDAHDFSVYYRIDAKDNLVTSQSTTVLPDAWGMDGWGFHGGSVVGGPLIIDPKETALNAAKALLSRWLSYLAEVLQLG